MKTIADFKRKMTVGAKVNSKLYWQNKEKTGYDQINEHNDRTVIASQSNSFALTMYDSGGRLRNSWCDWPKKEELTIIDDNTAQIDSQGTRLIYQFQVQVQ